MDADRHRRQPHRARTDLGETVGLVAVWMFALIYAVKYGAWEFGIRYNYGMGANPIEGYAALPGPKNWYPIPILIRRIERPG